MNNSLAFRYETESFCTPETLGTSVNYVNLLLTSYGYPVPIVVDSSDPEDKCKIINCIYALINDRKKDMQEKQQLLERINQLDKDQEELQTLLANHKREYMLQDKRISELKTKLDASEKEQKRQLTQNTRLKEEMTKAKNNMQYMKAQYAHETKRHEQDMAKIQERLLRQMNNHMKINVASLDMNSHFAATMDNAADDDEVVQVRAMYSDLLLKATNRERDAKRESEDLRTALIQLYTGVRHLLEDRIQQSNINKRDLQREIARFSLPMDCGAKEALKEVEDLLVRLRMEWSHQIDQRPDENIDEQLHEKEKTIQSLEQSMEDLLQNIEAMKIEYEGKMQVYKRFEQGGFFDTVMPQPEPVVLSDSESSVTELDLENIAKYKTIRKRIMRDRRKITEAAEELGKQRAQLEAEKWAIKQLKYEIQKREILGQENTSPPRNPPEPVSVSGHEPGRPYKRYKLASMGTPSGR
ncbi:hypothetical protein CU097_004375 [Rhizopus azygosporus]|uniref:Uncharacterized protein n=1 Tax=Rhizopus azygosporus TaxID=86630 RepID=A0A367JC51_RHIAZ|nr:hypothetical protein CU097_004375 [Rhizopus azygosporus]